MNESDRGLSTEGKIASHVHLLWAALGLYMLSHAGSLNAVAADWPMRGRENNHNPVSLETGAPTDWTVPLSGMKSENVKWEANLGYVSCCEPVIADGLVWVGTNNGHPRDQQRRDDASVLMCFRERDGQFLYQYVSPRLIRFGQIRDWPINSLSSSPLVEGDRLWFCTNRCEVVCLDISALKRDGGEPTVVWNLDMQKQLGVVSVGVHLGGPDIHCSVGSYKDWIYVNTTDVSTAHKPQDPAL